MLPIYYSIGNICCVSEMYFYPWGLKSFIRSLFKDFILDFESMYIPTPPAEIGVGMYSKLYPVMFGLKSIKFEFDFLVLVTPMILNENRVRLINGFVDFGDYFLDYTHCCEEVCN